MDPETTVLEPEQPVQQDAERVENDAARAAYDRARGARAARNAAPVPAPVEATTVEAKTTTDETPPADPQPTADASTAAPATVAADASAAPAQPDRIAELSTMLTDLKAQVGEQAKNGASAVEIRKLYGEIGSINQTLKLLAKSDDAPADLADAIAQAEKSAEEYPEIAGPLVKIIKAMRKDAAAAAAPPVAQTAEASTPAETPEQRAKAREDAAIKSLDEVHPDRLEINKSPEFIGWLAKQPPDYQTKFRNSWNPAVVAKTYDEYKAQLKAKAEKQQRLNAAVTPTGTTAGTTRPTALTEDEIARREYDKHRRKRL